VPADALEIARRNNDEATRKALLMTLPTDAGEARNTQIRNQAATYYYSGQLPPQNIFNPLHGRSLYRHGSAVISKIITDFFSGSILI
jgi:hypothetical protein